MFIINRMTDRLVHAERARIARQCCFLPLLFIALILLVICCGTYTTQMRKTDLPENTQNILLIINTYFLYYMPVWGGIFFGLGTTVLFLEYFELSMRKSAKEKQAE